MTKHKALFRLLALSLVLLSGTTAGCNKGDRPKLGLVKGTVYFDGQPLAEAAVVFVPAEGGRQSLGQTDSLGVYQLTYLREIRGAIVGTHRVSIYSVTEEFSSEEPVPARYNRETILSADVQPGSNTFDFKLTSSLQ